MKKAIYIMILSFFILSSCRRIVLSPDERGVIFYAIPGILDTIVLSDKVTIIGAWNRVFIYDISEKQEEINLECLLSDDSIVGIRFNIKYTPNKDYLPQLHETYGTNYLNRFVIPNTKSITKDTIKYYKPSELSTDLINEIISEKIKNDLSWGNYIDIVYVELLDAKFGIN